MKFHISRWRYWWAYLTIFILVLLAIWLTDNGMDSLSWVSGGGGLVLFVIMEFVIRMEKINIADSGVEFRNGKDVTILQYSSISDVSLTQSFFQHLLRFGDVQIKMPGSEVVLKGFEEAAKIEKVISMNIHKVHEGHEHHAKEPHVGP